MKLSEWGEYYVNSGGDSVFHPSGFWTFISNAFDVFQPNYFHHKCFRTGLYFLGREAAAPKQKRPRSIWHRWCIWQINYCMFRGVYFLGGHCCCRNHLVLAPTKIKVRWILWGCTSEFTSLTTFVVFNTVRPTVIYQISRVMLNSVFNVTTDSD